MLRNKVASTLFRSLLRWVRRPEVVDSRFQLSAAELGIEHALPAGTVVRNAEGLQGAIFHCFRTLPGTSENIDLGFKVLRELNSKNGDFTKRNKEKRARETPEAQALAIFRVGQIVKHVDLNVRGVVTGWSIDLVRQVQVVEVLSDMFDGGPYSALLSDTIPVDATGLKFETDRDLHRIINHTVPKYFEGYDITRGRYVPTEENRYWYSHDIALLEKEASTVTPGIVGAGKLKQLNMSLKHVNTTIASMGRTMSGIVQKHADILKTPDRRSHANSLLDDKTIAQQVLDNVGRSIAGCMSGPLGRSSPLSLILPPDAAASLQGPTEFYQRLRRGGAFRKISAEGADGSDSAKSSLDHGIYSGYGSKLIRMSATDINRVYSAVGHLHDCFQTVDLLLQLRFQHRGQFYHHGLQLAPNAPQLAETTASLPATGKIGQDPISPRVVCPPMSAIVEGYVAENTGPPPAFKVGQVVRHKVLGCRGVVGGFDVLPNFSVAPYGVTEQPVFKVRGSECWASYASQHLADKKLSAQYMGDHCVCVAA
jgi:heat shock protein HspQ